MSRTRSGPNSAAEFDSGLEHAASLGHVFAEKHDIVVAPHFLRDATGNGITIS